MPKPSAEFDSSVVRAIVPEMIGLKRPAPVAISRSAAKTVPYDETFPLTK
jgi:hypothetical protein